MVHENSPFLVVDFGVNTSIANEVDDPFLAFILAEAETSR